MRRSRPRLRRSKPHSPRTMPRRSRLRSRTSKPFRLASPVRHPRSRAKPRPSRRRFPRARKVAAGQLKSGANLMSEKSSATVTVACKLPNGLLIQLFEPYSVQVPILGGGTREELRHRRVGETYHIRGPIAPFGQVPKTEIAAGYALNTGVPRDLWEKWLEKKAHSALVRNK